MAPRRYSNSWRVRIWSRMVVLTWTLLAGFALALCAAMVIGRDCAEPASAASSAGESLLLISLAGFMASAIPTICLGASMRCDVCGRRFAVEFGPSHELSSHLHWQHVALHALRHSRFTCRYCSTEYLV